MRERGTDQLDYYADTSIERNKFDEAIDEVMAPFLNSRKSAFKSGALNSKVKRLMALSIALQAGITRSIIGQTKEAVDAGATKDEVLEACGVAVVMGGTRASAETWRVVKVLEEMRIW